MFESGRVRKRKERRAEERGRKKREEEEKKEKEGERREKKERRNPDSLYQGNVSVKHFLSFSLFLRSPYPPSSFTFISFLLTFVHPLSFFHSLAITPMYVQYIHSIPLTRISRSFFHSPFHSLSLFSFTFSFPLISFLILLSSNFYPSFSSANSLNTHQLNCILLRILIVLSLLFSCHSLPSLPHCIILLSLLLLCTYVSCHFSFKWWEKRGEKNEGRIEREMREREMKRRKRTKDAKGSSFSFPFFFPSFILPFISLSVFDSFLFSSFRTLFVWSFLHLFSLSIHCFLSLSLFLWEKNPCVENVELCSCLFCLQKLFSHCIRFVYSFVCVVWIGEDQGERRKYSK